MARKKKKRDYRAEYRKRIARGRARGLPRNIAAGHPKRGRDIGIEQAKALSEKFDVEVSPTRVKNIVLEDNKYTFGRYVRRRKKGHGDRSSDEYALRLGELKRRDGIFDWENEARFIQQMMGLGKTPREAYTLWFSPGGSHA